MAKGAESSEAKEIKRAHIAVKKYIDLLHNDGRESKKATTLFEKHKGNKWFVIFANLSRGVTSALDKGKSVVVELRHKPGQPPKLTRLPTRPLREPNKN